MTPREFMNAWIGYIDAKRQDYAASFEIARFGAVYNTFSGGQQKAVKNASNPYLDGQKIKKKKPISMGEISESLRNITSNGN